MTDRAELLITPIPVRHQFVLSLIPRPFLPPIGTLAEFLFPIVPQRSSSSPSTPYHSAAGLSFVSKLGLTKPAEMDTIRLFITSSTYVVDHPSLPLSLSYD